MLTKEIAAIISKSRDAGWVIEPMAKDLLRTAGLDTTTFLWTRDAVEAQAFAGKIGYPVVAKVVSPRIIHKSEVSGVITGITDDAMLCAAMDRLMGIKDAEGVLVEDVVKGVELIVGAKIDNQFGPVILFGAGGTAVEIYKDVAIRMAPLSGRDVTPMVDSLQARQVLEGYRGSAPVNKEALAALLIGFSNLVMDLETEIESIDLNPVICSSTRCIVADARIMLAASP